MVGGEQWRIAPDNRGNGRVLLEFPVKKTADFFSVPLPRMDKVAVQTQVARIEVVGCKRPGFRAAYRHIKDGQVEKGDFPTVAGGEIKGFTCLNNGFGRGAEQQVDIGGNACRVQGGKYSGNPVQIYAFVHSI